MTKSEFALKVNKQPSEITKWLSGTHNFTIDTICEIAAALDVTFYELIQTNEKVIKQFVRVTVSPISPSQPNVNKSPAFSYAYNPLGEYKQAIAKKYIQGTCPK